MRSWAAFAMSDTAGGLEVSSFDLLGMGLAGALEEGSDPETACIRAHMIISHIPLSIGLQNLAKWFSGSGFLGWG